MLPTRIGQVLVAVTLICVPLGISRADVSAGERLARQWCANCHVISRSGPSASLPQGPPSFRVAAGHLNSEQLRAFLTHPHGQMPDLSLTRSEIDDLIAYIESLR
jgi:mono/diheme cytochrome c family protein